MTSQRIGKYACLEVEYRYLLDKVPDDMLNNQKGWLITDRYLLDTRLRIRQMESIGGQETIYKLTQKYRSESQTAYEATITNVYLTKEEYNFLVDLEAKILRKKRYSYAKGNHSFSIDIFEGRHQGLILAEIEVEKKEELAPLPLPTFVLKEVTSDPFFSGGNLVALTDEEFKRGFSRRLGSE